MMVYAFVRHKQADLSSLLSKFPGQPKLHRKILSWKTKKGGKNLKKQNF